jgi:hypothetical protein
MKPLDKSGEFYLGPFGYFTIGRDTLGRLPDCGHLDANAWLEGYPGGAPFVRVELFCGLTGDPLPSLLHCACCLERLPQSTSLSRPALVPMLTG